MRRNRINSVPVISVQGEVSGVVSAADLVLKEAPETGEGYVRLSSRQRREHRKAIAGTAAELMTSPAHTIGPQATVSDAAELLRRHQVNQLPVTDESTGRLVGIVTRSDLLGVFDRDDADIHHEIAREVVSHVPGADPHRLRATVRLGVVTLYGQVPRQSTIKELIRAVEAVEGVVHVEDRLDVGIEDRYPAAPLNW
ncbi:CBS domain-containing protein [Spirillospora sp. NPDC048911]|uniref:CBS domain-containing protein n=1 Tax=Spirillospora sp. NPDC048911 TaxID=3364527 RepID=UPI0037100834